MMVGPPVRPGGPQREQAASLITTQTGQTGQTGLRPADFADVRATNLAVVLRHVRAHAPCSRADIAATTGLNKATVSSIVSELIDRRLVRESGLTEHRVGRPATMLVLDGEPYAAIGLEVDADHLTVVATDLAGERLLSWRRAFNGAGTGRRPQDGAGPGRAVSAMAALVGRAAGRLTAQGRRVLKLTVGIPGLVDDAGTVLLASNLGWRDVDLRGQLVRALRDPAYDVAVENDANLAVLAEHRYGAFAGTPNMVYIGGEVGIGAGVIVDGRLVRGGRGFGGELGHVQVDPAGPECRCGRRGCLEAVAGAVAIVSRVLDDSPVPTGSELRGSQAHSSPPPVVDLALEIEEVVRRARQRDRATLDALDEIGRLLGQGLGAVANLINPEVIALGGSFMPLAPWLLVPAEAELLARTVAPGAGGCRLVVSALGQGAAALGGAARALDEVDAGHLPPSVAA
jgi:predicted NBD/HSP70 family sugar kinase